MGVVEQRTLDVMLPSTRGTCTLVCLKFVRVVPYACRLAIGGKVRD